MTDETVAQGEAVDVQVADETESTTNEDQPRKKRRRRRRRRKSGEGADQPQSGGPSDEDAPKDAGQRRRGGAKKIDPADAKHLFSESSFAELGLRNSVLKGITELGFTAPTHIQSELIPVALEGHDVLGQARTGSGKTAAFGLPLFHMAQRALEFQTIVLVPTRELAIQIAGELTNFGKYTPIRVTAIYGGESVRKQQQELAGGPEIIVATPGRLMDLVERGDLHVNHIRFDVLDEVDRMLDIGFRDDIRKILKQIKTEHQTIFVSATISDEIEKLASQFMDEPVRITSVAGALTVEMVTQHYLPVERWDKKRLLVHLLTHEDPELTLVFCSTKRMVDDLTKFLNDKGIDSRAIHGDMPQRKRNAVMNHFRSGTLGVVVASDVAARGLDVAGISHVVNYDIPEDPEIYVHRIGRTARAGQKGVAWTFVSSEEGRLLTAVEKLANIEIPALAYPDFEPGPIPHSVREKQARKEQLASTAVKSTSKSIAQAPPSKSTAPDPTRFPGGIVPSKMPPKSIGGRVRTSRSSLGMAPPAESD